MGKHKETPNHLPPNSALLLNLIHIAVDPPVRTKDQQSAENILRVFMHLMAILFTDFSFFQQIVQLTVMLNVLLVQPESPDALECFFLEALYCSLGASLLDAGRIKFDEHVKRISCMTIVQDENVLAKAGELPGRILS